VILLFVHLEEFELSNENHQERTEQSTQHETGHSEATSQAADNINSNSSNAETGSESKAEETHSQSESSETTDARRSEPNEQQNNEKRGETGPAQAADNINANVERPVPSDENAARAQEAYERDQNMVDPDTGMEKRYGEESNPKDADTRSASQEEAVDNINANDSQSNDLKDFGTLLFEEKGIDGAHAVAGTDYEVRTHGLVDKAPESYSFGGNELDKTMQNEGEKMQQGEPHTKDLSHNQSPADVQGYLSEKGPGEHILSDSVIDGHNVTYVTSVENAIKEGKLEPFPKGEGNESGHAYKADAYIELDGGKKNGGYDGVVEFKDSKDPGKGIDESYRQLDNTLKNNEDRPEGPIDYAGAVIMQQDPHSERGTADFGMWKSEDFQKMGSEGYSSSLGFENKRKRL